jgi:hypothetical protein
MLLGGLDIKNTSTQSNGKIEILNNTFKSCADRRDIMKFPVYLLDVSYMSFNNNVFDRTYQNTLQQVCAYDIKNSEFKNNRDISIVFSVYSEGINEDVILDNNIFRLTDGWTSNMTLANTHGALETNYFRNSKIINNLFNHKMINNVVNNVYNLDIMHNKFYLNYNIGDSFTGLNGGTKIDLSRIMYNTFMDIDN